MVPGLDADPLLDAVAYVYPQAAFPYDELVGTTARGKLDPEFELLDAGVFDDDRYWDIEVDYAKASPHDLCVRLRIQNAGPEEDTIDVCRPCGSATRGPGTSTTGPSSGRGGSDRRPASGLGRMTLEGGGDHLACSATTRRTANACGATPDRRRTRRTASTTTSSTALPPPTPTRSARRVRCGTRSRSSPERRTRSGSASDVDAPLDWDLEQILLDRPRGGRVLREPRTGVEGGGGDHAAGLRRDAVEQAVLPLQTSTAGWTVTRRNRRPRRRASAAATPWRHLDNLEVISMPDSWEYPWYAAWDLAFHCAASPTSTRSSPRIS